MNKDTDLFATYIDPGTLSRLHRQLEQAAESEGLLDVAYRTMDSPVGMTAGSCSALNNQVLSKR